jgi:hypothetical protein
MSSRQAERHGAAHASRSSPASQGRRIIAAGGQTPRFTDQELQTIGCPLDFVGINVYKPGWYVEPSEEPPGYRAIPR